MKSYLILPFWEYNILYTKMHNWVLDYIFLAIPDTFPSHCLLQSYPGSKKKKRNSIKHAISYL